MTAKAIVWNGTFGDSTLPRISLGHTPALPGAMFDWAADDLPLGDVSAWRSLAGGETLTRDGSPQVVNSGGGHAVQLDGIKDRMRYAGTFGGERTFVFVYRFPKVIGSSSIVYGYSGPLTGSEIVTTSDDYRIYGRVDPRWNDSVNDTIFPSPKIVMDTDWHVLIMSIAGDDSAIRIDNADSPGKLTPVDTDGVTLGYGLTSTSRTNIEYKRVAVLPGGTTGAYRDTLTNQLATRYGITL